jgi:hypothetical protein
MRVQDPNYAGLSYAYNTGKLAQKFARLFDLEIKLEADKAIFSGAVVYEMPYLQGILPQHNLDFAFDYFLRENPQIVTHIRDMKYDLAPEANLNLARVKMGVAHQMMEWSMNQWQASGGLDSRFLPFCPQAYEDQAMTGIIPHFHNAVGTAEQYGFPYQDGMPVAIPGALQQVFEGVRAYDRFLNPAITTAAYMANDALKEMRNHNTSTTPAEKAVLQCVKGLTGAVQLS